MTTKEKFQKLLGIASYYADLDLEDGKHYWLHDFDLDGPYQSDNWDILYSHMRYRGVLDPYEKYVLFWETMAEVATELKNPLHTRMALDVMDW